MSNQIGDFADHEVKQKDGPWNLIWEWIGEGDEGDYNEDDPEDVPRLRASLYLGETQVDSYCTLATPTTPKAQLEAMAEDLFRDLPSDPVIVGEYVSGVKRPFQQWTWRTWPASSDGPAPPLPGAMVKL